jgi:hypothetical protein
MEQSVGDSDAAASSNVAQLMDWRRTAATLQAESPMDLEHRWGSMADLLAKYKQELEK